MSQKLLLDLLTITTALAAKHVQVLTDEIRCDACLRAWTWRDEPKHAEFCLVGAAERICADARAEVKGTADDNADGYAEPWRLALAEELEAVVNARGEIITAAVGMTVPVEHESRVMERIVACVNFCEGMTNEDLRKAAEAVDRVLPKVLAEVAR